MECVKCGSKYASGFVPADGTPPHYTDATGYRHETLEHCLAAVRIDQERIVKTQQKRLQNQQKHMEIISHKNRNLKSALLRQQAKSRRQRVWLRRLNDDYNRLINERRNRNAGNRIEGITRIIPAEDAGIRQGVYTSSR
jgi:hypothetical protein